MGHSPIEDGSRPHSYAKHSRMYMSMFPPPQWQEILVVTAGSKSIPSHVQFQPLYIIES